ncbi:MAG TPA: hypothetical protein VMH79_10110 [Thermoanaerobaculia bacterium]|nr:hypothetical protein [Thermoanaerobaculia bacterium]
MAATEHEHGVVHGVAAEPDYVPARLVVGFAVVLTVTACLAGALMAALFWRLDKRAAQRDAGIVEAAGLEQRPASLPPLPRLQVYPVRHWTDFREAERARLDSYGWMDRGSGAVHIPIERAIELVAERGVGPLPPAPMAMPAPAAEVKK